MTRADLPSPGHRERGRETGPRSGGLAALRRQPDFGRLYLTRVMSQFGDGVFQVALASYVLFSPERATTAGRTAAAFATLLLPYSIVGPFAGVFLDRWRRQRVLVASNVIRAALVLLVAALVVAGVDDWRFYVAALSVLSVNRFFLAALSAALPHVVEPNWLILANSVSTTSGTLVAFLGGGAGFGVREVTGGPAPVLLVAAVVYLGAATRARQMPPDLLGPDHDPNRPETTEALRRVVRGVADGARHVWSHRHAGDALAAIAAHRFFYGLSTITTVLLYRNYFDDRGFLRAGFAGLGQVVFASGLGVLAAAALTPGATRRVGKDRWIAGCFVAAAAVEIGLGLPFDQLLLLPAGLVFGFVAQASKICVDTIVQETVDDDFRGRVFSFYDILFNVSFVSAAAVAALTLPASGKSYAVVLVVAAGYAVSAAGYLAVSRRRATARA